MLSSANKLAKISADFLICPDNTVHQALPYVEPRSPLPWLHIAKMVAAQAVERGFRRVGLTATRYLVDRSIQKSSQRAEWSLCDRTPPNAKKSIASSWMSWFTASSSPRRSLTFSESSDG